MVVSRSKAGPSIEITCTSEEITSGRKPAASMCARGAKAERAAAVADVEDHAAGAGRQDLLAHLAVGAHRCVGERTEAMGEDVARPEALDDLAPRRRRRVEMGHHRQAGLLGDVEGDVERLHA